MSNAPLGKHSLLISDLHLCDERQDLSLAFEQFCTQHAMQAEQLFILGDLSDAWVGDDDDSVTSQLIRQQLKALTQAGVAVYLMTGNRDFLMGEQLADNCGLNLLSDPSVVDFYGHSTLLLHGDSLCIDDQEYMAFRQQMHNKAAQQMLLQKPLPERRQIAAMLRAQSKSANSNKAEDIMDVSANEVIRVMAEHNVTQMIHGHTHRPAVHDLDLSGTDLPESSKTIGKRYVLGDWGENVWYIKANTSGFNLHSFKA